jgi:hypothetical protein
MWMKLLCPRTPDDDDDDNYDDDDNDDDDNDDDYMYDDDDDNIKLRKFNTRQWGTKSTLTP